MTGYTFDPSRLGRPRVDPYREVGKLLGDFLDGKPPPLAERRRRGRPSDPMPPPADAPEQARQTAQER